MNVARLAVAVVVVLAGCGDAVPNRAEYALVFADEFNAEALDAGNWTVLAGENCGALCADGRRYAAAGVTVRGGSLMIAAGVDEGGNPVSGAVHSAGKFSFRYGRVEVGALLPVAAGVTAALQLLPSEEAYGPWPSSGGIGLAEGFFDARGAPGVRAITRYGLGNPAHGAAAAYNLPAPSTQLVEYALEWDAGELRFFVDGKHVQSQSASGWFSYYPADAGGGYDPLGAYRAGPFGAPFDQPFHLALGLAAAHAAALPQPLQVDYVRVYECDDPGGLANRCGSRDAAALRVADGAGGPLAGVAIGRPFRERIDLFEDGPSVVAVSVDGAAVATRMRAGTASAGAATVASDTAATDPEDSDNTVWRVAVSGGGGAVHLAAVDAANTPARITGFDLSGHRKAGPGGEPHGEIAFDMRIDQLDANTTLSVGASSGYPATGPTSANVGEGRFPLPRAALAIGAWKSYSVKLRDLTESSPHNCCGLSLARVDRPFVLSVNGAATLALDNIRVTNACRAVDACGADATAVPSPRLACAPPGTTLRYGFYAFFAPVSHSADENPAAPGHRLHRGYEADLVTALEALEGAGLAFQRHPIGVWTGIWLRSAGADLDVVGGGITILESRTRDAEGNTAVRFTDGHIAFRQSLLVRVEDAARLATHAMLTSDARVGALADTTGEARLLQLTGLADADGRLAAGVRLETPRGTVTADGTAAYRITSAEVTENLAGRTRLWPPDNAKPQVIYLGYERGEAELLEALRRGAIDAVARGEIGNSDAAAASGGRFIVTALDAQAEYGGFTVAADNPALLQCLNDKLRWLTNGGRIGYREWRQDASVFLARAEAWSRLR